MTQVKPVVMETNSVKRESSNLLRSLIWFLKLIFKYIGMFPMDIDPKTWKFTFALFSWTSLFSFIRLVAFNAPLTLLPVVILYTELGLEGKGNQTLGNESDITKSFGELYQNKVVQIVFTIQDLSCFLYYVLPFLLCYKMAKPFSNIFNLISTPSSNSFAKDNLNGYVMLFPIVCFLFMIVGNLIISLEFLKQVNDAIPETSLLMSISLFGITFTAPLGLHFLLAVYELSFYHIFSYYESFAKNILSTKEVPNIIAHVKDFVVFLDEFQEAFGCFLLVDLALMLFFWLSHCYIAFINSQVSGTALSGSLLVIVSELLRVVSISSTCEHITKRAPSRL